MVLINEGKVAEAKKSLAEYLKLAPTGPNAADGEGHHRHPVAMAPPEGVAGIAETSRGRAPPHRCGGATRRPFSFRHHPDRRVQDGRARRVRAAAAAGQRAFGENRVQEGLPKIEALSDLPLEWHLIGHLQSNKAKRAAGSFAWIQSVDSVELLQRLDRAAAEAGRRPRILIQVDLAHEATKHGADEDGRRVARGRRRAGHVARPSRPHDRAAHTRTAPRTRDRGSAACASCATGWSRRACPPPRWPSCRWA